MMPDYFALLELPRRPWLDPLTLREKFLALSAAAHPDRVHDQGEAARRSAHERSAVLNAAYQCLREPKDRLRHLLALERGAPPDELQRVEPQLLELFAGVNDICRRADAILQEKKALSSPMLQVKWFEQAQECRERLQQAARELAGRGERLDGELKQADEQWTRATVGDRSGMLERLEEMYRLYGFFHRWNGQVQGRMMQFDL